MEATVKLSAKPGAKLFAKLSGKLWLRRRSPSAVLSVVFSMLLLGLFCSGCASYRRGSVGRSIPGGYKQISIPVFKNTTQETGVEVYFTNSLILEFQRSKVAQIVDKNLSEVLIEGTVDQVSYTTPGGALISKEDNLLPTGTALTGSYTITMGVTIRLIRQADGLELWKGTFVGGQAYTPPQVSIAGVNSVNPLYNQSARRQNIEAKSKDIMAEAHDRITENF